MQKKENVIVVANLFAFGIVCYSKKEDRILLIPKTENESDTDGSGRAGIAELLGTYFYTSSFCRRGKRLELAAILAAFVCFCLYISERNFLDTNLIGYLAFIAQNKDILNYIQAAHSVCSQQWHYHRISEVGCLVPFLFFVVLYR